MDVYCPKCAEPVEMDYFHDIADEQHTTYAAVARNFRVIGCAAIGESCNPTRDVARASASAVLMDIMGDDMDGVASMLEDAEYLGMF